MINYYTNNILLCILYHIFCICALNKITTIPQHRYLSYKEMNIFLIMCLNIFIVLTLQKFASNWFHNLTPIILIGIIVLFVFYIKITFFSLDLLPYECISSIVMKMFCRLTGKMSCLAL